MTRKGRNGSRGILHATVLTFTWGVKQEDRTFLMTDCGHPHAVDKVEAPTVLRQLVQFTDVCQTSAPATLYPQEDSVRG